MDVRDEEWSAPTRVVGTGLRDPRDRPPARTATAPARPRAASRPGGSVGHAARHFVRRWGWRAYALPVLAVVTLVALLTAGGDPAARPTAGFANGSANGSATGGSRNGGATGSGGGAGSGAPVATGPIAIKSDSPGASSSAQAPSSTALPPGPAYTLRGTGTFRVLAGHSAVVGHGRRYRYDVEVENGVTGVDLAGYAALVQATLSDPRSWSGHGVALQRVDSGPVDFHVDLTSAMTVRQYCGYDIKIETSCYAPAGSAPVATVNRVVLDVARWVRGSEAYVGDLAQYRVYMINHEDGHALGHEHAHECLPGGWAPVMMQQTFGLRSATTLAFCKANPWPYPPGVSGAPGAEQPDTDANSEVTLVGGGGRGSGD